MSEKIEYTGPFELEDTFRGLSFDFYTCGKCGSVVMLETVQQHNEWHAELEKRPTE